MVISKLSLFMTTCIILSGIFVKTKSSIIISLGVGRVFFNLHQAKIISKVTKGLRDFCRS